MDHSLPQRPLRFATAQAYDLSPRGSGTSWVERSAEPFALDERIGTSHDHDSSATASAQIGENTEIASAAQEAGVVCANPLRDEPSALAVGAVRRFGLVGLVSIAIGAGIARWWNSFSRRDH